LSVVGAVPSCIPLASPMASGNFACELGGTVATLLQYETPARNADASITTRVWRNGAWTVLDFTDALDHDGVVHIDVCHGADPDKTFVTLSELCGSELQPAMIADLLDPDELPEIKDLDEPGVCAVSAFAVEAVEPPQRGQAGTLRFLLVEFLANNRWVVTCCHPATSYAGMSSPAPGSALRCDALLRGVDRRWAEGGFETAGDLAVLLLHELTCTYGLAWRKMTRWLEEWERAFYTDADSARLDPLRDIHALISEFRARLNALNVPQDEARSAWFRGVSRDAIPRRADKNIDKALAGLDRLGDMLRSTHGLVQAHRAQSEQNASEKRQRHFELASILFIVPTVVAGTWGENTWVPGQNRPWGFALTLAVMALAGLVVYWALQRSHRRGAEAIPARDSRNARGGTRTHTPHRGKGF
jgi:Mg2+ and Co2+ transporter CorA